MTIAREIAGRSPIPLAHADTELLAELLAAIGRSETNVTAVRDPELGVARHVLDALAGVVTIDGLPPGPLADVGSGAGIPGIVLAIARPQRAVSLIESVGRKCRFLRETVAHLGLGIEVLEERSETLARGAHRERYAVVCARALAPPPIALELCAPLCAVGGSVLLWSNELAVAEVVVGMLGCEQAPAPPGLLRFERTTATPARFPRRPGMAVKRPLSG